jgi:MFS family permease
MAAVSPAPTTRRPALAELLRRPGYPGFVLTVGLARASSLMFNTSGVLLVLARTGSAPLAGATAAAAVLPAALSGPLIGAWLEVAERRRVLIVLDQLVSVAGLLAIVALAGHAPNWTVPAVAVLYSVTRPFSSGSFFSALAEIAGSELLDAASAVEASSLNLAVIVGPALAGALAGATSAAIAIEVQAALTVVVAFLIAINPAFEARPEHRAESAMHALRDGTRALVQNRVLRATATASTLAAFGWGLMLVGFPLYAAHSLHEGANAGGYLWAGIAVGSILGTFILRGNASGRRVGSSYAILGLSALAWPLAHAFALAFALVTLTGFLEGPAYSGTIALRQRHTPAALRAQVITTISGLATVALAAGAALGGAVDQFLPLVLAFTAINAFAALAASRMGTPLPRAPREN